MNVPMAVANRLAVMLLVILSFAALGDAAETTDLSIVFGFADGRPAVYFAPQAGMKLQLMNILYDSSGKAEAYDLELNFPSGKKLVIALKPGAETDRDSLTYRYRAVMGGKAKMSMSLEKWEATKTQGLIAFFPEGMGGSVLHYSGTLVIKNRTVKFSYDSLGHRNIASDSFSYEGTTYEFRYSDHQRDDSGRLTGYVAEILTVNEGELQ